MADSNQTDVLSLGEAIQETLNNVIRQVVDYAPEVIGAALVLLVGWGLALAASLSTRKLAESFDSLFTRFLRSDSPQGEKFRTGYPRVLGKIVFWIVMIFFVAVASNILNWGLFSGWMQQAFSYLPGIITGILIIIGGLVLANLSSSALLSASEKSRLPQRVLIAKLTQVTIIFCAVLVGVDQIGLNINFLNNIVVTVVGVLLAGAALAFGLGAKDLIANVIGARYLQRHCKAGDHISLGGTEGEIVEISQASVVIRTENGRAIIPAELFHREVTLVQDKQQ